MRPTEGSGSSVAGFGRVPGGVGEGPGAKRCLECGAEAANPLKERPWRRWRVWRCGGCGFEWIVFWGTGECGFWKDRSGRGRRDVLVDVPRGCLLVAGREEA